MSFSMYGASIPAFLNTLGALSKILDKTAAHCEAKKIDPAALLTMRLYPDMFMFTSRSSSPAISPRTRSAASPASRRNFR